MTATDTVRIPTVRLTNLEDFDGTVPARKFMDLIDGLATHLGVDDREILDDPQRLEGFQLFIDDTGEGAGIVLDARTNIEVIEAAELVDAAERALFWAWAANMNVNAAKIGDRHDILKAYRKASPEVVRDLTAFALEFAERRGVRVSREVVRYVDWRAYLKTTCGLSVIDLSPNEIGIFNPDA